MESDSASSQVESTDCGMSKLSFIQSHLKISWQWKWSKEDPVTAEQGPGLFNCEEHACIQALRRLGLARWLSGKESACQCRRYRFDPWSRKIPREGNGNPLQYSSLENLMDREPGGLQATRWMLAFAAEGLRSLLSPHAWPVTNSAPNWVHLAWFLLAVP